MRSDSAMGNNTMPRIDARVRTRIPAHISYIEGSERRTEPVVITELSLSSALVEGPMTNSHDMFSITPHLPRTGDVELFCEVLRTKVGAKGTPIRFFYPDKQTLSTLWDHLRDDLVNQSACPYCGTLLGEDRKTCGTCGYFVDFDDSGYLDRHLKTTFLDRVRSRMKRLDSGDVQRIITIIDSELLNIYKVSFDQEFVGTSPRLLQVFSMIRKVAKTDMNVLILGESGTGKELTAKAIHERSDRKEQPFVIVNCAAIPEGLLEAELFGFEKGSFTGAHATKKGKFEDADGGTIFLDEIGDLSPGLQAKVLRFLEDRIVERVGARKGKLVNVRVIAATNCDLNGMIEKGGFRSDLFFRLNAFTITLPPLRERGEDTVILAKYYLRRIAQTEGCALKQFSQRTVQSIREYPWPGNVRELINKVRRGIVMATGENIEPSDMELEGSNGSVGRKSLRGKIFENQREHVLSALTANNFVITKSAKSLGISRTALYAMIKKHSIRLPS